jgi:hypothetical protein
MNAQFNPLKTQPMPTRERLARMAEATTAWAAGKVADYNARRALERRDYYVQGWQLVQL